MKSEGWIVQEEGLMMKGLMYVDEGLDVDATASTWWPQCYATSGFISLTASDLKFCASVARGRFVSDCGRICRNR